MSRSFLDWWGDVSEIPKQRKQFRCKWCDKNCGGMMALNDHISRCRKKPFAKCKHPVFLRKKRYQRVHVFGGKLFKTWSVDCRYCGKTVRIKKKRYRR